METIQLTPHTVESVLVSCLFGEGTSQEDALKTAITVKGICQNFGFDPAKIKANKDTIYELLQQLPPEFMASGGGGMSFLNACIDKNGNQWTGEHRTVEQLMVLGIAANFVTYCLPREMWPTLPGGMPYFVITQPREADDGGNDEKT